MVKGEADKGKERGGQGQTRWTQRDLTVLRWVCEQYAVRLDQLPRLLGRGVEGTATAGRVSDSRAKDVVGRWRREALVEVRKVAAFEPAWLWLSRRGRQQLGLPYRWWQPKLHMLSHMLWVNEVRLSVEERKEDARWRCERDLRREAGAARRGDRLDHVPDGEVLLARLTVAVEVELTAKSRARTVEILDDLVARYRAVWYFASTAAHHGVEEAVRALAPEARQRVRVYRLDALA